MDFIGNLHDGYYTLPGVRIKFLFALATCFALRELFKANRICLIYFLPALASIISLNYSLNITMNQYELLSIFIYTQIINLLFSLFKRNLLKIFVSFSIMITLNFFIHFFEPATNIIFLVWCLLWKLLIFPTIFGDENNFKLARILHTTLGGIQFFSLLALA